MGGRYSATVFGIINTAGSVGGLVSPVLFGWIVDRSMTIRIVDGIEKAVPDYTALFVTVAVWYIVSAFAWLMIDCSKPIEDEIPVASSDD